MHKNFSHNPFRSWPQFSRGGRVTISRFLWHCSRFYQKYIKNDSFLYWILLYVPFSNSVPNFSSIASFFRELRMLKFSKIPQIEGWTFTASAIMNFWFFRKKISMTLNTYLFMSNYKNRTVKANLYKGLFQFKKHPIFDFGQFSTFYDILCELITQIYEFSKKNFSILFSKIQKFSVPNFRSKD